MTDAQSGEPLAGVVVDAHWPLYDAPVHGRPVGEMMVIETVTDEHGRFRFEGWGPKARPPGRGRLLGMDPQVLLFKAGYEPKAVGNDPPIKAIVMDQAPSDSEQRAIMLVAFVAPIQLHFLDGSCEWRKIPRMLTAVYREARSLPSPTAAVDASADTWEAKANVSRCGSLKAVLERNGQ